MGSTLKYPKIKDIKRQWLIRDQHYDVVFKKQKNMGKDTRGECSPEGIISIAQGISREQVYETLVHELLHAIEFEYGIDIPHKLIYELEVPLTEFLLQNFNES